MSDAEDVAAANQAFYAAIESGDLDRIEALWDEADDVACVHPGWPAVRGRSRVLRSWAVIMANTAYIQFFPTGVEVAMAGDVAVVACEHSLLARTTDSETGLGKLREWSRPTFSGAARTAGGYGHIMHRR